MPRRLSTLLTSLAFLLSAFHLEYAQPPDNFSDQSATTLTADDVSPVHVVPDNTDTIPNKLNRPASLAGEPTWMTSDIVHKPRPEKPRANQVSAQNGKGLPPNKPKGSRESTRKTLRRDAIALFEKRQRMFINRFRRYAGYEPQIIDGHRTAREEAKVIRSELRRYGIPYVIDKYGSGPAIREIVQAHTENRRRGRSIPEMTRVIENQVRMGIFISPHLQWRAIDVRSRGKRRARLSTVRQVARSMGARVSVGANYYHIDLV